MDLLYSLIYRSCSSSTHHKFALDGLSRISSSSPSAWRRLFLYHHADYLRGAKDPDTRFRDFKNHVLHVYEDCWGGAIEASTKWYRIATQAFREEDWAHGVYASGVLSHYVTDPLMPFHSAQNDEENNIHRACEWSIFHSYDELFRSKQGKRFSELQIPEADDWLSKMLVSGANYGQQFYDELVTRYNFDQAVKHPVSGLDRRCREIVGTLLVYTVEHWALILSQLLRESGVAPPEIQMAYPGVTAVLQAPRRYLVRNIASAQDRELIRKMHREWKQTGKVEETQPLDEKTIDELYKIEVLSGRWSEQCELRAKTGRSRLKNPLPNLRIAKDLPQEKQESNATPVAQQPQLKKQNRLEVSASGQAMGQAMGQWVRLGSLLKTMNLRRPDDSLETRPEGQASAETKLDRSSSIEVPPESMMGLAEGVSQKPAPVAKTAPPTSRNVGNKIWRKDPPQRRFSKDSEVAKSIRLGEPSDINPLSKGNLSNDFKSNERCSDAHSKTEECSQPGFPMGNDANMRSGKMENEVGERALRLSDQVQETLQEELTNLEVSVEKEWQRQENLDASLGMGEAASSEAHYLLREVDELSKVPGLGGKSAKRLGSVKIRMVADLLAADPSELASSISAKYIDADLIRTWQDQARLMCDVPELIGVAAQLLIALDYRTIRDLAGCDPRKLFDELDGFSRTGEGLHLLGNHPPLEFRAVNQWIENAKRAKAG